MLEIIKTVLPSPEQWEIIIEGMRNPMNSWAMSDSGVKAWEAADGYDEEYFALGDADHDLMMRLAKGGPVHGKYRRMIPVFLTINAPLYWWKEFDTYKVGTVANSCSTMHKIHAKEFTMDDFSHEHLYPSGKWCLFASVYAPPPKEVIYEKPPEPEAAPSSRYHRKAKGLHPDGGSD